MPSLNPECTRVLTIVFESHFKSKTGHLDLNTNLAFWVLVSWYALEFALGFACFAFLLL